MGYGLGIGFVVFVCPYSTKVFITETKVKEDTLSHRGSIVIIVICVDNYFLWYEVVIPISINYSLPR